ncbi:hypothetical protein A2J04_09500 [Rhodococcus sp. EPR-279]|nr:hypothetical protein A2J04_09500 [Rhodococcus sp. EPR-279]
MRTTAIGAAVVWTTAIRTTVVRAIAIRTATVSTAVVSTAVVRAAFGATVQPTTVRAVNVPAVTVRSAVARVSLFGLQHLDQLGQQRLPLRIRGDDARHFGVDGRPVGEARRLRGQSQQCLHSHHDLEEMPAPRRNVVDSTCHRAVVAAIALTRQ